MTVPLYTDADLRSEAAVCLSALSEAPSVADILRWLPGAYVDSYREDDGSGQTWGDVLDNEGLAETARKIHALIGEAGNAVGAINSARWLVGLGADGLEADPRTVEITEGTHIGVRIHFAFDPDLPEEIREQVIDALREDIRITDF
ncbi:hypothetical protein [Streptomyces sp. NPDC005799]|uniref:hypothetical protein n=1 Tax=Streptomyces sp. NPDC005799 TaxID=3154678 RepID=UPI0034061403